MTVPSESKLPNAQPSAAADVAVGSDPFGVGSLLAGKYQIERLLGEGGLGVVVLANHVQLERRVAIKYLQRKALKMEAVVERFTREGQLGAMLRSEHVVRVHDVATLESGEPYLVMEYLEGQDLSEYLNFNTPPVVTCVDYIIQACDALAEAHAKGIVHRDLKPANLFIARKEGGGTRLKVLDFGISKLSERLSSSYRQLTTANDRFGTPSYMPPEQFATAAKVDARSDIWALGVILYELFAQKLPFDAESMSELSIAIGTRPPQSLLEVRPDLPPELEQIVFRCLEKNPDDRFTDVAELAHNLAPFASPRMQALIEQIDEVVREAVVRRMSAPPFSSSGGILAADSSRAQELTLVAPKTPSTPSGWDSALQRTATAPASASASANAPSTLTAVSTSSSTSRLRKNVAVGLALVVATTAIVVIATRFAGKSSTTTTAGQPSEVSSALPASGSLASSSVDDQVAAEAISAMPVARPALVVSGEPHPSAATVAIAAPTAALKVAKTPKVDVTASAAAAAAPSASASTDKKNLLLTR